MGNNIFIGHGHSRVWEGLRDFIDHDLQLPWDEFNRVSTAGVTTIDRLSEMLDASSMAFLILTAEDERLDGKLVARMNVVHEAGLFQGRLGFRRAIVLIEEGCEEFSNIHGLGQIRFPRDDLSAKFEAIRRVLEREGLGNKPGAKAAPVSTLSREAIDFLIAFEKSGCESVVEMVHPTGVRVLQTMDAKRDNIPYAGAYFEDDVKAIIEAKLLYQDRDERGRRVFTRTRAASDLVRSLATT